MECPCVLNVWTCLFVFFYINLWSFQMQILVTHLGMSCMLYLLANKIHINIVSESVFVFTLRSLALERSRRIQPLTDGACRGSGSTSLPLHPLPSGWVVSGEGDQTCRTTASLQHQGGGERCLCLRHCRIDEKTVESTRPRHPATVSCDPTKRDGGRMHHHQKIKNGEDEIKRIETC